jgi:hypothetical protein
MDLFIQIIKEFTLLLVNIMIIFNIFLIKYIYIKIIVNFQIFKFHFNSVNIIL